MSKILETRIQYKYDSATNWDSSSNDMLPLKGELLVYSEGSKVMLKVGDGEKHASELPYFFWTDKTNDPSNPSGPSTPSNLLIPVPSNNSNLVYNGYEQSPDWKNYDSSKMEMSGTITATTAGTYTTKFTPTGNYMWLDGSTKTRSVSWKINKKESTLNLEIDKPYIVEIDSETESDIMYEYIGDGQLSCYSDNPDFATATITNLGINIRSGGSIGNTTITVVASEGPNYTGKSIQINVKNKFATKKNLNDLTWKEISDIAAEGNAANYFDIGDMKEITVDTTSMAPTMLELENKVYAFIIGFNHKNSKNTIDFSISKVNVDDTIIDGVFCGEGYSTTAVVEPFIDFCINVGTLNNIEASSIGGWASSYMRQNLLGANSSPINPRAESFLAALSHDLREVLKIMDVYADNFGGTSDNSRSTVVSDYLTLPSAYEVGIVGIEYCTDLAADQQTYDYYLNSNQTPEIRQRYDVFEGSEPKKWWLRSTIKRTSKTVFACVDENGNIATDEKISTALGVCPIFRV